MIDLKKLSRVWINLGNGHFSQENGKKYEYFLLLNYEISSCIRRYIIVDFDSSCRYLRPGNFVWNSNELILHFHGDDSPA